MYNNLFELIKESQYGDKTALLEIIKRFEPILKKYSRKLNYDGANTDLIISLIETIKLIPIFEKPSLSQEECIVGYIANSLKYKYIKLSKKYTTIYEKELELNEEILAIENNFDIETYIMFNILLDSLPSLQKKVLNELFINGCPISELAKSLNVSRQAINQAKNRALENLKKNFN